MKEKEIAKKKVSKKQGIFNAKELYKFLNTQIIKAGYIFAEKEQKLKGTQYGELTTYTLLGFKTFDKFAKGLLTIEVRYEDMNKVKVKGEPFDQGNLNIKIKGVANYDYGNDWDKSDFKRFMLDIYLKYLKKEDIKNKYAKPIGKDVETIYKAVKEHLELY